MVQTERIDEYGNIQETYVDRYDYNENYKYTAVYNMYNVVIRTYLKWQTGKGKGEEVIDSVIYDEERRFYPEFNYMNAADHSNTHGLTA